MPLTRRRRRATEKVARKRAVRFSKWQWGELLTQPERETAAKLATKEEPHRDPSGLDVGHYREWNGTCDCPICRKAKAMGKYGYKGKAKKRRLELEGDDGLAV